MREPASLYRRARLLDPDVVAQMAAQPVSDEPVAPSVWESSELREEFARTRNVLNRILFAVCYTDPNQAPVELLPEWPHQALRREKSREVRASRMNHLISQLIPGDSWERKEGV